MTQTKDSTTTLLYQQFTHPLLKWGSFLMASVILIAAYAIILACSYEQRSAHWIGCSLGLIGLLIATYASIIYSSRHSYVPNELTDSCRHREKWYRNKWAWGIIISAAVAFISLACLLSTAWLKGDDFTFMGMLWKNATMESAWKAATHRYTSWVARFGDFYAVLFPLSENRWQVWLINPALVVSIPFALFRLFRNNTTDTIASPKGVVFFWFCFFLFLLSGEIPHWRNFWCYAASTNYLYPSVGFIWLLSCYNPCNWTERVGHSQRNNEGLCIILFILGFICGWGMECTAVTIVPLLVLWVAYHCWRKMPLPTFCCAGAIGTVWGAFTLFASPSHAKRLEIISNARKLDVYSMSPEQISDFVQNLDWDKVNMLKGAASLISLDGIPLWQHIYFLPYLWEHFWDLSNIAFCVSLLLLISLLFSNRYKKECKRILIAAGLLLFACIMACSYLAASIPHGMSFLPCAFMVATAAAFLFFIHSESSTCAPRQMLASLLVSIVGLMTFLPAGIEAWKLKPQRDEQLEFIHKQRDLGNMDVELPYPLSFPPANSLDLIGILKTDKNAYPNASAAKAFKIRSIRQLPYKKPTSSAPQGPATIKN